MADAGDSRHTPLYDQHLRAGAKMVDFAGWVMPVRYGSEIEEHHAVRRAAGLFDVSHMGEVRVRGDGALEFLQSLTPNDVTKLRPGRAHYSGLLTEQGTYVDDLLVYMLAENDYLVVVNAANVEVDYGWMVSRRNSSCRIDDHSDKYALLALQGPKAPEILSRLTDVDLATIKYYRFIDGAEIAGMRCLLSRTGYTGELGFELYLPPEDAPSMWQALLEAGADDGLVPCGLSARDTLRLEAGMALYGHEIDRETTPYEAGLGWVVKLASGDFVGRDALVRQRDEGVGRKLVGFEMLGKGIARQSYEVLHDGEAVGTVCSGTWSPTFDKALGTAYVPPTLAEVGTEIEIQIRKRTVAAKVVDLPFYRRS
ncbi:MAG: glycine cleavage system aminomethyltransferase GcvT [Thermoanaerobaculia bacterium]|nr:glycine cleavage system aminomethyltransferase GcvT [Thermoanaerobaculia bacterium]